MICSNCGKEIADDSLLCNYCGSMVAQQQALHADINGATAEDAALPIETAADKKTAIAAKKLLIAGLVAAGLGITIFLAIVLIGFAVYGRVYLYDGYSYTRVLCTLGMVLMLAGAASAIIGAVLSSKKGSYTVASKQNNRSIVLASAATFISLVCSTVLIVNASRSGKSSSYSYSSYSSSPSSYSSYSSGSSIDPYLYAMRYLKTSDIKITHNSLYTVCTGTIKNTGPYTIKYVKIRGAFQNISGSTLDTDWTYAVGSEGLGPGESTTFRMSVRKNEKIRKCEITFINS